MSPNPPPRSQKADIFLTGGDAWADAASTWREGQILLERFKLLSCRPGGMGEVWKAEDLQGGGFVALKRLLLHLQGDEKALARFQREMKILRDLDHPKFVRIYQFLPEVLAFSMEWLEGQDLRQFLQTHKRLPLADAFRLVQEIADALSIAHQAGVIHRDLKPENIFLVTPPDRPSAWEVKVLDFGIALHLQGTHATTSFSVGTAYYMAPEQHDTSADASAATDIYALGQIFYEVITGTRPVSGRLPPILKTFQKLHADKKLAPSELPPDIQDTVFSLLDRIDPLHQTMIEHDPADRCSLSALHDHLRHWQAELQTARHKAASQRLHKAHDRLASLASTVSSSPDLPQRQATPAGTKEPQAASSLAEILQTLHADTEAFPEASDLQSLYQALQDAKTLADTLALDLAKAPLEEQAEGWSQASKTSAYPFVFQTHSFSVSLQETERRLHQVLDDAGKLAVLEGFQTALRYLLDHPFSSKRWQARRDELQLFLDRLRSLPDLLAELASSEPDQASRIAQSVLSFGASVIPDLLEALKTPHPLFQTRLLSLLPPLLPNAPLELQTRSYQTITRFLASEDDSVVSSALDLLASLGESVQGDAHAAIRDSIKEQAKAGLLRALCSTSSHARQKATTALSHLRFHALDELLLLLQSPLPEARVSAAAGLGYLGRYAAKKLQPLLHALRDPAFEVAFAAASALPSLLPFASNEGRLSFINTCFENLAALEPPILPPPSHEKPELPALSSLPFHTWPFVQREGWRQSLVRALAACGPDHLNEIIAVGLARPSVACYEAVALLFLRIGEASIPWLRSLFSFRSEVIDEVAIFSLSHLTERQPKALSDLLPGPDPKPIAFAFSLSHLWRNLHSDDPALREEAIRLYAEHGRLSLFPLRQALRSSSLDVRLAACQALEAIGPSAAESLPLLQAFLDTSNVSLSCASIRAIGSFGFAAFSALPTLHKLAWDSDTPAASCIRSEAAKATQRIASDPHNEELPLFSFIQTPLVAQCLYTPSNIQRMSLSLGNPSPPVRKAALEYLAGVKDLPDSFLFPHKKRLPSLLVTLFRGEDPPSFSSSDPSRHRNAAAQALGLLGKEAKDGLPALRWSALNDPLPTVRHAALQAVEQIEKALGS